MAWDKRASQAKYYQKNKKSIKEKRVGKNKEYFLDYYQKNKEKRNNQSKQRAKENEKELFRLMKNMCKCCGETDPMFLQIDHVKNDGYLDRKKSLEESRKSNQLPNTARTTLSVNKYKENPKRYQLLCANCNHAKHKNGGKLYKPKKRKPSAKRN